MPKKSVSTLIYFQERSYKKRLGRPASRSSKAKVARVSAFITRLIVLLVILTVTIGGYLKYHPLTIQKVLVSGDSRFVNISDIQKVAEEKSLGENILLFEKSDLVKVISANFLGLKDLNIKKIPFHTLQIQVTERVPIAVIHPDAKDNYYFVDSEGFILGMADKLATNLPVINYNSQVYVGKFVEAKAISYYFDLIKALDADDIMVSTISSYPHYTQFFLKDGLEVLLNNDQNPDSQTMIFAKMLEAFRTEGKKIRKIDLRFDKVIVEFIN